MLLIANIFTAFLFFKINLNNIKPNLILLLNKLGFQRSFFSYICALCKLILFSKRLIVRKLWDCTFFFPQYC